MANKFIQSATAPDFRQEIGRYRVLAQMDDTSYAVEEPHTRRRLLLKLRPIEPADADAFLHEARRLPPLEHEHIVPILDAGIAGDECYVATELPRGEALSERLKREHRLPMTDALRIAREMAAALAYVHAQGLCHGEICPANIWLEPTGRSRLIGFSAGRASGPRPLLSKLDVVGVPGYLSPEQAAGEAVGPASDLFSLGCVLFHLMTGERPFRGESSAALLRAVVFEHPTAARLINPDISETIGDLIMRLLAKLPADRPISAEEVEDCLTEWLDPTAPRTALSRSERRPAAALDYPASKRILEALEFFKTPVSQSLGVNHDSEIPYAEEMGKGKYGWLIDLAAAILLLTGASGLYYWWESSNRTPSMRPPAAQNQQKP